MEENTNTVIVGFPGVGKTCAEDRRKNVLDYESSGYHWILNPETKNHDPNPAWPDNYLDTIERNYKERYRTVLAVSSHPAVIKGLKDRRIPFIIVAPDRTLKDEYLGRYLRRGSGVKFIREMDRHWNEYLNDLEQDYAPVIHLDKGQYLVDILPYG